MRRAQGRGRALRHARRRAGGAARAPARGGGRARRRLRGRPRPARPRPAPRLGRRRRRCRRACGCSSTRWPRSPTCGRSTCTGAGAARRRPRLAHSRATAAATRREGGSVAGRIRAEDIATVKERTSIEDVVREHVTLRPAGVGSLKGLCPFHDEKTPSFTSARPSASTTASAAARAATSSRSCRRSSTSPSPRRSSGSPPSSASSCATRRAAAAREGGSSLGKRSRLIEAHRVAAGVLRRLLLDTGKPDARVGRDFLRERGFDRAAAERFGIGFAPQGGEALTRHLRERGFTDDEMVDRRAVRAGQPRALRPVPRAGWSGRSATSPATPSASAPAGCSTTTGSPRSTSTPPRRRSTRSRRCSTASTPPRRPSPPSAARSSSRATPTSWPPPRRRRERGRHLRHGLRRRPHQDPAPHHARRDRRPPGPRHLHLRRRRRRPEGRDAGVRRGPALGRPDVRRRRPRRHGPLRAAHRQGRCRRARPRRRRRADVRVRRAHHDPPLRPRHRRGPGRRR